MKKKLTFFLLLTCLTLFNPPLIPASGIEAPDSPKYKTIHIVPLDMTLSIGEKWQFSAIGIADNNEEHDITSSIAWSITPETATIDKNGTVIAEHPGEYWITAAVKNILTAKAKLTVIDPVHFTKGKIKAEEDASSKTLTKTNSAVATPPNGSIPKGQSLMQNTPPVTTNPKIKSIGGYGDGLGVSGGKWTGQGPSCSSKGKGKYNDYYAVESVSKSFWTINGSGFGDKKGKTEISDKDISVLIDSWSDKFIKIYVKTNHNYTSKTGVTITVTTFDNKSDSTKIKTLGMIQTRGYGQCTWYVADSRLDQGKSIPPTAYSSSQIEWNYEPQQWDCLNYQGKHVGIIMSAVTKKVNKDQITYSFRVGEMNALCDEKASTYNGEFIIDTKKKIITKHIGSNAGKSYEATGFYR